MRGTRYVMPGDYATVEADGSITLLGRGSIVINSGGEKIFPEEVESAVRSHPDVMDAIVCGAPDERWGQTVAAIIQPRVGHDAPSLESIQEHCRESIAGYKLPRRLYVVDAVERSPSGKPDYTWAAAIVNAGAAASPGRRNGAGLVQHPEQHLRQLRGAHYGASSLGDPMPSAPRHRSISLRRGAHHVAVAACAGHHCCFSGVTGVATLPGGGHRPWRTSTPPSSWTVYHGNPLGIGVDTSGVTFIRRNPAWTSPVLDGQVYGEPLEATGRVYVATENDTVYALAADTGAVLWSTHVGTAVPSGDLPCGDISPTVGITGTPVIDADRGEIFAVADELVGGTPAHFLVGLNMYTGAVDARTRPSTRRDRIQPHILQRTGLNLEQRQRHLRLRRQRRRLLRPTAAGSSRCPRAAGRPATTRRCRSATTGPSGWAAPRPRSTRRATSGWPPATARRRPPTTTATRSWSCRPSLACTQFFAPSNWRPTTPRPRPRVEPAGTALQRDDPPGRKVVDRLPPEPGVAGRHRRPASATPTVPAAATPTAGTPSRGRSSTSPATAGYRRCRPARWASLWQTTSGANGPPITAGGLVWSIGGSALYGLNPTNGATVAAGLASAARPTTSPPRRSATDSCWPRRPIRSTPSRARPASRGRRRRRRRRRPNSSYWMVASDGGHLHLRQRRLLRLGRQHAAEQAGRRHGADGVKERLLAGGVRRRDLQLRRRRILRVHGGQAAQQRRSSAWPPRRTVAGTGWWPPTAASSASATPPSTAPWGASR